MGGGQGEKDRTMGPLRPSDVDFMPGLLRSLAVLLRLRGKVVSPQFLMAGLTGNKVTPQACLRAARKARPALPKRERASRRFRVSWAHPCSERRCHE